MSSVIIKKRNSNRGRPRKPVKPSPPKAVRVNRWCGDTGQTRGKAYDDMAAGKLKYVVINGVRHVLASEYLRFGLVKSLDELV